MRFDRAGKRDVTLKLNVAVCEYYRLRVVSDQLACAFSRAMGLALASVNGPCYGMTEQRETFFK